MPTPEIVSGADAVMARLRPADIAYAGSPERGRYRGFAALHDLCDANMLLPGADDDHEHDMDAYVDFCNAVMDEVTARIVAHPLAHLPAAPKRSKLKTYGLHFRVRRPGAGLCDVGLTVEAPNKAKAKETGQQLVKDRTDASFIAVIDADQAKATGGTL